MSTLTYRNAIVAAQVQEMERDASVFLYGLDVSDHKRIFGSTAGIVEKFGPERCFITPTAEDSMAGFGLGAALCGMRPVHIHIRVDFMLLTINQLANMYSNLRYMSGGRLSAPVTMRAVIGRGWGQSCQHSKSMQSLFAHIPGIKVVMPTSPADAKGLLAGAIRDDNPVVVLEHRMLYDIEGEVPDGEYVIPMGKGRVVREGADLTVIATSWMNIEAVKAAEILERRHGVSLEVVDPRTIHPLDEELLVNSVNKTGRCLVADYDWTFCGFSAEAAALIGERCFGALRSPVTRLGFAHVPCPTTRPLENAFYPNAESIVRSVEKTLDLPACDLSGEVFYTYEHNFKGPF
ncbi:transketolase C-terminal domain-containing protein [Pseudodesulfovibrio sp.]|uniref:alpha-ketoacid dehydrogenase subunit beta n=1 Tax=Pseudodesulfovibrio sp. TaxID=2035812 RepID=UPI002639CE43|nr:transketolase C-terminal domain-containing protein [Pseudodesulfovibrio sp.]MDD3312162.1 transketolase C-terminal domain-containing protein [Pseudodesulfovibrio sp.]